MWCGKTYEEHKDEAEGARLKVPCLGIKKNFKPRNKVLQNKASWEDEFDKYWKTFNEEGGWDMGMDMYKTPDVRLVKVYIKENFVHKDEVKRTIAELEITSSMENELKFGDGTGSQKPNYKDVIDKLLKSLD